MSKNEEAAAAVVVEGRRWEALSPEILALIFVRIQPSDEMVRCVPFVCKPWMEVVAGPYCWRDINLFSWSRSRIDDINLMYLSSSDAVAVEREDDLLVEKLVRRSSYTVQRLSVNHIAESGFLSVVNCGRCLKILQIPRSRITDDMVLKHIKPLPNLEGLDISFCSEITSKGLAAFGNNCKSLVHLKRSMRSFYGTIGIDESEAKTIAHTMPSLQRIELCYGKFGNSGVSEILTKCKSLTHLDVRGCWNVVLDDDLLKTCERLEHFQYDYEVFDSINSKDVDLPSPTSD